MDPSAQETEEENNFIAMADGSRDKLEIRTDGACIEMLKRYHTVRDILEVETEKKIQKAAKMF